MSYPLPPPELPPIVETLPSPTVTQGVTKSRQEVPSSVPKSNQGTEEIILSAKTLSQDKNSEKPYCTKFLKLNPPLTLLVQ